MFSFGHCPNYLSKPSQLKIDQKFGNPTLSRIPPHCLGNLHLPIYRCTEFLDSWIKIILAIIIILLIFVTTLIVVIITYHGHHHDLLVLKEKMLNLFSCLLPRSPVLAALKILFIAKT